MKFFTKLLFSLFALSAFNLNAQTTLISPTGDGGFENGSTFASNGWITVNPATDTWQVGSVPVVSAGSNCAYVSADGGTSWNYSQLSVFNHLYRDVTIPVGESKITLSFKWKAGGEGTTTSDWDNLKIYWAPTTTVPSATATIPVVSQISGPGSVNGCLLYTSRCV